MLGDIFRIGVGATLFDDPRFRLNDPRAVDMLFDGRASPAGITVTRQTALTCSPWYRGIRLFSDLVAKLPLSVYQVLPNGGKVLDRAHPWSTALTRKSGLWYTPFQLKQFLVASSLVEGNGYAWIDRAATRFRPLNPRAVTPTIEVDPDGEERLFYVVGVGTAKPVKYHADEIIHVRGLSIDCLTGLSVIDIARESLGLSVAAKRYQAVALKNSAKPGIILKVPGKMQASDKKALAEGWERMLSGGNANRTIVLDMGMDATALGFTAEEVQLIETQQFLIADIANFIGLPAHKFGDNSKSGYAGLEQENLSMLGDSIDPVLVAHEQEFADKLLTEDEKQSGEVEILYDRDKLSTPDTAAKTTYLRTALGGHPWLMVSEARQADNKNHLDGTDYVPEPVNMTKDGGGDDAEPPKPPAPPAVKPTAPPITPPTAPPAAPPTKGIVSPAVASAILSQSLTRVARRLVNNVRTKGHLAVDRTAIAAELADVERLVTEVYGVPFGRLADSIADIAASEFMVAASAAEFGATGRFELRINALGVLPV